MSVKIVRSTRSGSVGRGGGGSGVIVVFGKFRLSRLPSVYSSPRFTVTGPDYRRTDPSKSVPFVLNDITKLLWAVYGLLSSYPGITLRDSRK